MPAIIRPIEDRDLPALTAIYNHYVVNTPTTFDIVPLTLTQRRGWFGDFAETGRHRCFVAEKNGAAVGWACSARLRGKEAYDTSVEASIYLAADECGRGLGKRLYRTLFEAICREDVHRAYALITLPNEASVALHIAMGFSHIGTMDHVGRKFGRFLDVAWFELAVFPGMPLGNPSSAANPLL
jgi:phosphinothricin acetyltransferase